MFLLNGVFKYTTIGLGVALGLILITYQVRVSGLKTDVMELQMELQASEMNRFSLKSSIEDQNKAIDAMVVDMVAKDEEIEKWKNKPADVRYETVYKRLPADINLTKDDCETVRSVIGSIRGITL